jgi:predicted AAA+ superfamily ATPase
MHWIKRSIESQLDNMIKKGKVFILYGARRVGKTSVIEKYITSKYKNYFIGNGDDIQLRKVLSSENKTLIDSAFKKYSIVFIDEAQRIPNIGWGLKILIDSNPELILIASGSSSFQLSNQTGEPLTGRNKTYNLHPIAIMELIDNYGGMSVIQHLNNYLIYGTYPELILTETIEDKIDYLRTLQNSYLFKDILELENIKNPDKLFDLLKLIAFQIGNEVSLNELSLKLGIAKQTVSRYLELLEKTFVIKKIRGYSSNLRKEVIKSSRYYFWDNGIRNAIINNFNDPSSRMDMGMLWENFCFIERLKKQHYQKMYSNNYFWRTYDQQEIDMIEERDGKLWAYEFKWNPKKTPSAPKVFTETYKNASYKCITPDNFIDFLE